MSPVLTKPQPPTVIIQCGDCDEDKRPVGTGFVISNSLACAFVVTCLHVICRRRNNKFGPQFPFVAVDGHKAEVVAVGTIDGLDVTLLSVSPGFCDKSSLPLVIFSGLKEEDVLVEGYRIEEEHAPVRRALKGTLSLRGDVVDGINQVRSWDINLPPTERYGIQPGYSGSPVIEQQTHCVIGILIERQEGSKGDHWGVVLSVQSIAAIHKPFSGRIIDFNSLTYCPYSQSELKDLLGILGGNWLPPDVADRLYRQVVLNDITAPDIAPENDAFIRFVYYLARKACNPPRHAPLLEFIQRVVSLLSTWNTQHETSKRLNNWLDVVATRLGVNPELFANQHALVSNSAIQQSPSTLQIVVAPIGDETETTSYMVSGWLCESGRHRKLAEEQSLSDKASLPIVIAKLVAESRRHLPYSNPRISIEIFLPPSFLNYPIHLFQRPLASGSPETIPLGVEFPVIVRPFTTNFRKSVFPDPVLRRAEKWKQLQSVGPSKLGEYVYWASKPAGYYPDYHWELVRDKCVFIGLTFKTPKTFLRSKTDILRILVDSGIPVALWTINDVKAPYSAKKAIECALSTEDIRNWPETIARLRRKHLGVGGKPSLLQFVFSLAGRHPDQAIWQELIILLDDPDSPIPPVSDDGGFLQLQNKDLI